jgi:hypothetical protein
MIGAGAGSLRSPAPVPAADGAAGTGGLLEPGARRESLRAEPAASPAPQRGHASWEPHAHHDERRRLT